MKPTTTQNFNEVLKTIQHSKQKALKQINTTLIELYWEVGRYISAKTVKENWGKGVVKDLALFIKKEDPTIHSTGPLYGSGVEYALLSYSTGD